MKNNLAIRVSWFLENFGVIIRREGWDIYEIGFHEKPMFIVTSSSKNIGWHYEHDDDKYIKMAKRYGWICYKSGQLESFDEKIFKKNKHLIVGSELGLL